MNLIQIARMLWARRALILILTVGGLLAGALYAKSLPQRYEATSRLMLDVLTPDPVSGNVINSRQSGSYLKSQAELIKDYRTTGKVVDEFGWTSSPELAAAYAARSSDDHRDFRRWLAQIVNDSMAVNINQGSNIIEIVYSASSPDVARRAADAVRQAYIDQAMAFKRETAASTGQWFDQETQRLKRDLAQAEKQKADFEKANGIILQDNNVDTETARLQALAAAQPLATPGAVAAAPFTAPSTAQLAQIDTQIALATGRLGPNHPQLIALREQRKLVEQAIQRETAAARASTGGPAGPNYQAALSAQTQKVLERRGLVGEAQRLATNVTVLRDQYQKTASRGADLKQQALSPETGVTLLGNAVAPEDPVSPNVPLIIMSGLGIGVALGLGAALGIEILQRRVRGIEDLAFEGIPVIGMMERDEDSEHGRDIWYWLGLKGPPWRRAAL
ncbi:MAG: GumC family protein [Sphingobium sp.]